MSLHLARTVVDRIIRRTQRREAQTPYGRRPSPEPSQHRLRQRLSDLAEAKVQQAIQHAWAESTLLKYASTTLAYHHFCDTEGVSQLQQLPAGEFLLCAFAASRAGEVAGATARGAMAAVKALHIAHDVPWNGGVRLRYTLRGVDNLAPAGSKLDARPPVTADMIALLESDLNHNDPKDVAVFATACTALWGQIRLGELLSATQGSFKRGRIPSTSDLKRPTTRAGSHILHLPYTKTKRAKGEDAMICRQHGPSDPIRALENHLSVNDLPPDMPLFSHRDKHGDLICLTRKKFLDRCNEVWSKCGLPAHTGHCFRIGGTTELLLAGVNPDVVQAMGRWRSDAFKVYWRRLDLLAPLHAELLAL